MRIDAYNAVNQIYQTSQISKAKATAKTSSASDKFEISQTARTAVSAASDVREDKIADIKARMAAGTYNISSEAVADKILNNISTLTF